MDLLDEGSGYILNFKLLQGSGGQSPVTAISTLGCAPWSEAGYPSIGRVTSDVRTMGIASLAPIRRQTRHSRSRGTFRPRFASSFAPSKTEGAGKTGCALHPRSRVQLRTQKRTRAYRFSGSIPAFPAQWLYGLLRALPGERLFCHRHPLRSLLPRNLTPAPRRQDHTTSPYASRALVLRALRVHRISPHVRDDREPPLIG